MNGKTMYNRYYRPKPKAHVYDEKRKEKVTAVLKALAAENGWTVIHEWTNGKKVYRIR